MCNQCLHFDFLNKLQRVSNQALKRGAFFESFVKFVIGKYIRKYLFFVTIHDRAHK